MAVMQRATNRAEAKRPKSKAGRGCRRSTTQNAQEAARPAASAIRRNPSDARSAYANEPTASASRPGPSQSIDGPEPTRSDSASGEAKTTSATQIGRLIQKIHGQPTEAAMSAPSGGPMTIEAPMTVPQTPKAQARRWPG